MIYLPESAAKAICKKMFDIHMNTQTYPGGKWAECHVWSASFLTQRANNRIRGVSLGIIPSKKTALHKGKILSSCGAFNFIFACPHLGSEQ